MPVPALPLTPELADRLSGRPLMLLLDVDGTLAPIAPRPEYAAVPPATQHVLEELTQAPDTHVVMISGRAAADALRVVGVPGLWVIGNHGFEIGPPNGAPAARDDVAEYATRIADAVARLGEATRELSGVIVEDKRWTLSVHYRLAHPRDVPAVRERVETVARALGLRVTGGKEVFELRPPVDVNKGTAAVELADRLGALHAEAALLCAGDDRTDEDMFGALRARHPRSVTVRVGVDLTQAETHAEFCVADPDAMRELLEAVLARRREAVER